MTELQLGEAAWQLFRWWAEGQVGKDKGKHIYRKTHVSFPAILCRIDAKWKQSKQVSVKPDKL